MVSLPNPLQSGVCTHRHLPHVGSKDFISTQHQKTLLSELDHQDLLVSQAGVLSFEQVRRLGFARTLCSFKLLLKLLDVVMRRILLKRRGLIHEPLGESFHLCRSLLILIAGDLDFVLCT